MIRPMATKSDIRGALGFWTLAFLSLSSVLICSPACAGRPGRSADELTVDVGGHERTYRIYKPAGSPARGLPMMIVLHGGLGNGERIEETTRMNEVADRGLFLVAYPEGTGGNLGGRNRRTWNAGRCCGRSVRRNVNDVEFIDRMIRDIEKSHSIDSQRIYVAGLSNGGMMAYRLACELPERFAAVIAVAGTLAVDDCDRARDVAVLHIHGDADENVPYAGGRGRGLSRVAHRSVPETMRIITRPRHCKAPEETVLPAGDRETSYHCARGAPVRLRVVSGEAHGWPGGRASKNERYSASTEAGEFARRFSRASTGR
jgi:polyhydroxybutyrate depolymerase